MEPVRSLKAIKKGTGVEICMHRLINDTDFKKYTQIR